jgi:plasmid stabilization system protein ParE
VRIRWSPLAVDRVAEIAAWIAADRPEAADRLVDGIFAAVERLADFPNSGRQVPEFDRPDLREMIFRSYRIIYRRRADRIDVLTVRHSMQLLDEQEVGPEADA